jgi:cytochrome o ubiquinol oxidase operon protein cyoD
MSEIPLAPTSGAEIDLAPGEPQLDGSGIAHGVRSYLIGLALAAALTAASFYFCFNGLIYEPAIPAALIALAVAQMGVHLVFFLHLTTGPDNTNNALALAFGVLIVTLVIGGSLWIMANMNHNMMPVSQVMEMQR